MMYDTVAKYVVVTDQFGNELPVVFPVSLNHSDLRGASWNGELVSGGFVQFSVECGGDIMVTCSGKSVTAGVGSRPDEDAKLIELHLNLTPEKEDWICSME